jgi:hypothetical protein
MAKISESQKNKGEKRAKCGAKKSQTTQNAKSDQ